MLVKWKKILIKRKLIVFHSHFIFRIEGIQRKTTKREFLEKCFSPSSILKNYSFSIEKKLFLTLVFKEHSNTVHLTNPSVLQIF